MDFGNGNIIAIQPIRKNSNKVVYLKFIENSDNRNQYQFFETDLTQYSNRLISNLTLEKSKNIDFFKIQENEILYGGFFTDGNNWFDSLPLRID